MIAFYEKKPDKPLAFGVENLTFPAHIHLHIEMLYVLSGEILVNIDGTAETLHAGGMCTAMAGQAHSYESKSSETVVFMLPQTSVGALFARASKSVPIRQFLQKENLPQILHDMWRHVQATGKTESDEVLTATGQLLFALYTKESGLKKAEKESPSLGTRAVLCISERFTERITLESTARALNISKYYLSRILNDFTGMNFCNYVNTLRINYAKSLLKSSTLAITQIALESGFENLRSFNRAFQKQEKITPREFKRL